MPKYPLKAWGDSAWQRKLSRTVTVSRVDADIPTDKQKRERKPWYIALTQKPDLLTDVGGVAGLPAGNTMLLSEHDVVALVRYLLEPQTAVWAEEPTVTKPGEVVVFPILQPGMVAISKDGELSNGESNWSPDYFKRQLTHPDYEGFATPKIHTLPWKLER